tara:strand:- start:71 stop:1441 length:1371 start_codon:yes stop_codon:yes gene_type:complete
MKKIISIMVIFLLSFFVLSIFLLKNDTLYKKTNNFIKKNIPYSLKIKLKKVYTFSNSLIALRIIPALYYNHEIRENFILYKRSDTPKIESTKRSFVTSVYSSKELKKNGPKNYLDISKGNLFSITGNGIFSYTKLDNLNKNQFKLKTIRTNINKIVGYNYIAKNNGFILDLFIRKDEVFISYVRELKKDCFNTSIIKGNLNLNKIHFEEYFTPNECIDVINDYGIFRFMQSGGAISDFNNNDILLSTGEFRYRDEAQNKKSVFGKVLRIKGDGSYEVLSMGHRNPQGLFYDSDNNIIISAEHGPKGGDEINLNRLSDIKIKNFGWPIASYGEHYGAQGDKNSETYLKLLKSHKNNGFIEPFVNYVPSIAPTRVIAIKDNSLGNKQKNIFLSALGDTLEEGDMSIHRILINENYEILESEIIPINHRIRDMIFSKKLNKMILFLEKYGSIATIEVYR